MLELLDQLGIVRKEKSPETLSQQAKDECDKRSARVLKDVEEALKTCTNLQKGTLTPPRDQYAIEYKAQKYPQALAELDKAAEAVRAIRASAVEKKKAEAFPTTDEYFVKFAPRIKSGAYGKPPVAELAPMISDFDNFGQQAEQALLAGKWNEAQNHRVSQRSALIQIKEKFQQFKDRWDAMAGVVKTLDEGIKKKTFDDLGKPATDYAAASKNANKAEAAATAEDWDKDAIEALVDLEAAVKELRKAQAAAIKNLKSQNKPTSEILAQAIEFAKRDPNALDDLAKDKEGRKLLDDMVASLGGTAKGDDKKAFCKAAMKARFGIQNLEGDLSTKALPRMYKVFALVPVSHTQANPMVKTVKRDKKSKEASCYGSAKIDLNLSRTTKGVTRKENFGIKTLDPDDDVPAEYRLEAEVNYFDHTTLHEIGHAVDDNMKYMNSRHGNPKFGGWEPETVQSVADIAATVGDLYGSFPAYSREALKKYVISVLEGGDGVLEVATTANPDDLAKEPAVVEADKLSQKHRRAITANQKLIPVHAKAAMKKLKSKDPQLKPLVERIVNNILKSNTTIAAAVKAVLNEAQIDFGSAPDWKKLAEHKAYDWCCAVRLKGTADGLWEKGKASKTYAVGGRIYHEAYTGKWTSYDAAARSKGVSSYQFRAEGEWFAELYANFYMELLSDSHPDVAWLKADVHSPSAK